VTRPYEGRPKLSAAYDRGKAEAEAYDGKGEARKLPSDIYPGSSMATAFEHGWEDGRKGPVPPNPNESRDAEVVR